MATWIMDINKNAYHLFEDIIKTENVTVLDKKFFYKKLDMALNTEPPEWLDYDYSIKYTVSGDANTIEFVKYLCLKYYSIMQNLKGLKNGNQECIKRSCNRN